MSGRVAINRRTILALLAAVLVAASVVLVAVPAARALSPVPDSGTWMPSGTVFDTELSADGKTMYIGGKFGSMREKPPGQGGAVVAVRNLAAIDVATGRMIQTFKPQITGDASANVRELAFKNGKLYVGGTFTAVNGQPRGNLAAVNATTGAVDSFNHNVRNTDGTAPLVYALETDDSRLYVGGRFNFIGNTNRAKLAAFNLTNGALDANWKPRLNREAMDLQMSSDGDSVFAVGRFRNATGSNGVLADRKNVARFDTSTGNLHPWSVPAGVIGETDQTAHDVLVTPNKIYVGLGDKGPNYISAFRLDNGDVGSEIWRYGTVGDVQTMALSANGKRLFFGGHFGLNVLRQQACDDRMVHGLASLNPNNGAPYCDWLPTIEPFNNNGYGPWDMNVTSDGRLWVGGGFNKVSGSPQLNLAGFNPNAKLLNQAPRIDLDGFGRASGVQPGGLNVSYFDNMDLTGTEVSGVESNLNLDWGGGSPAGGIDAETFSTRLTGQIEAPVSGEYTFYVSGDNGTRLRVDGQQLTDRWRDEWNYTDTATINLQAGQRYDVLLEHFDNNGGANLRLEWSAPGIDRQVVPASNLFFSADGLGGLDATYYDNMDLTGPSVSRIDRTVNFDWGNGAPVAGIGPDTFSVRWTGEIEAPVSGEYTFYVSRDNGGRLKVDDEWLVEEWSDTWGVTDTGTINLQAGERYPAILDFFDNNGGANVRLEWSAPGLNRQVIPASNLFYAGGSDYAATFAGGPTSIVGTKLAVADPDDATVSSATVTLNNRRNGASESLRVDAAGTGITAGYNAQTGVLTLGGTASKATYAQVLRTITYNNTAASPAPGDRTAIFVVNDGASTSGAATSTITVP